MYDFHLGNKSGCNYRNQNLYLTLLKNLKKTNLTTLKSNKLTKCEIPILTHGNLKIRDFSERKSYERTAN